LVPHISIKAYPKTFQEHVITKHVTTTTATAATATTTAATTAAAFGQSK
jgi:hypothetical protein